MKLSSMNTLPVRLSLTLLPGPEPGSGLKFKLPAKVGAVCQNSDPGAYIPRGKRSEVRLNFRGGEINYFFTCQKQKRSMRRINAIVQNVSLFSVPRDKQYTCTSSWKVSVGSSIVWIFFKLTPRF